MHVVWSALYWGQDQGLEKSVEEGRHFKVRMVPVSYAAGGQILGSGLW